MKVYIIQENYTCAEENFAGECYEERQATIQAVCTSREALLKALPEVITQNHEEYYQVDIDDYELYEVEVPDDGFVTFCSGKIDLIILTDEERAAAKREVNILIEERIKKYGG